MSTIQVWNSVEELASEWAKSPLVEQLTSNLPANNPADSGVPEALRNLDAGTSIVSTHPLLTAMWEPLAEGVRSFSLTFRFGSSYGQSPRSGTLLKFGWAAIRFDGFRGIH